MRRRPGIKSPASVPEPEWYLSPSSEWTRESGIASWVDEAGSPEVAELLYDVGALGFWFTHDPDRTLSLLVEQGTKVPGDIIERLRHHREGLVAWWRNHGTRYEPLEAAIR